MSGKHLSQNPKPNLEEVLEMAMQLTDANFDTEVTNATGVVLVDFWAPWCGPCRMVGPIIEEISQEYEGKAKVGKLNVDENGVTAGKFGVMSIPTMLIFKDGKVVEQLVGALPKAAITDKLDQALS